MEAGGKVITRLLLVDLDGTIREPLSGGQFIQHPQDQRIIKGADKAIAHYHKEGWVIVGITNQGGVAAGFKQLSDAIAFIRVHPRTISACALHLPLSRF